MEIMYEVRHTLALRLMEIEEYMCSMGATMPNITLIMRDPANDEMILVVTSEDQEGLEKACRIAPKKEKVT